MKSLTIKPSTRAGWWALGLAAAYFVLMPLWSVMGPLGAWPAFICGAAGGVVGLVAVARLRERSVLVYLSILPLLLVLAFLLGEFLVPH